MRNVKSTNLLYYIINLKLQINLVKVRVPRYTLKKKEFIVKIFLEIKEIEIII